MKFYTALACSLVFLACSTPPPVDTDTSTATESGSSDTTAGETEEPVVCGPEAPTGLGVGDCAPDFSLPDRDGVPFSLHAQRGKVALVDISAIW